MKLTKEIIQVLAILSSLVVIYMLVDVTKLWMTLEYGECNEQPYRQTNEDS